jgi:hypothetical protein
MKIQDLTEKGPIIGAPKGSQKDARLSPGTDDPSKYMRGGEWEAYREPQGVSSNAGKIAGGTKKGTTRTKNKKVSEEFSYLDQPLSVNLEVPVFNKVVAKFRDFMDELVNKYDVRVTKHPKKNRLIYQAFRMRVSGKFLPVRRFINEICAFLEDNAWSEANRLYYDEYCKKAQQHIKDKAVDLTTAYHGTRGRFLVPPMAEGSVLPPGGPGASGDLVPRDPHATTIAMVKNTAAANIAKSPKLAGSEAPTKFVKKQVKKSLDNRPGNVSDINEQVERILAEAIPRVVPQDYSADYELRDDKDQKTIGVASISHGVIELLSVRNDIIEDFGGHIMSRLLNTIVRDADAANANLAIALDDPSDLQHKRFMERFGFRAVGKNIMKRNAGSVTPPSVPTARL